MKKRIPAFIAALAIITSSTAAMPVTPAEAASSLPSRVDLSETEFYPGVMDQDDLNSCGPCAAVFGQFTYEVRKYLREKDSKADINFTYSPLSVYTSINGGEDNATYVYDIYEFLSKQGALTEKVFPYIGKSEAARLIPRNEKDLFEALKIRLDSNEAIEINQIKDKVGFKAIEISKEESDARVKKGIRDIKTALNNGKVLVTSQIFDFSDYIAENVTKNGKPFNELVSYQNDDCGGTHFFTIVGYDDEIACDLNGDKHIDPETEMGAFKIANSYGDGWKNNGYLWIMYDALYRESLAGVEPIDPDNGYSRTPAFTGAYAINVVEKDIKLVAEADIMTNNYYDIFLNSQCKENDLETSSFNKFVSTPVVYNGPVLTDITEICGDKANNKTYRIDINNNNTFDDTKVVVKSVCLKDDKGNVVVKKDLLSDDQVAARFNRLAPGNYGSYELSVDFPAGDINYDGVYDKKDYTVIKKYYENSGSVDFSLFQQDLIDVNGNQKFDESDYEVLKKTYKK